MLHLAKVALAGAFSGILCLVLIFGTYGLF